MAALAEGEQYGLSSSSLAGPGKTVLLLKLTDSSLRAIEGYQKLKNKACGTPTIQFKRTKGVISLPGHVSADGQATRNTFNFSMTPFEERGTFECIHQCKNRYNEPHMEVKGCIQHKLKVLATEEVYQDTKDKMALAQEEMRKSTTNFIDKATGKHIGNKVKVKKKIQYRGSHKQTAVISRSNGSKIVTSGKPHISKPPTSQGNSKFPKVSYRDKIIHLLALKPYKKLELVLRLQKDHVNQKDKNQLGSILQQVATMKDNAFTLNKPLYNEVREDWPLYSEGDKQLLKRKLAQVRSSSNELSPPQNSTHSTSPSPPQKRPAEPDIIDPKYKKPRIAHPAKVPTNNNTISNSGVMNNALLNIKSDAVSSTRLSPTLDKVSTGESRHKEYERKKLMQERLKNKDSAKTSPVRDKISQSSPSRGSRKTSPDVVHRESVRNSKENSRQVDGLHNGTSRVASSASSIPETKYTTIASREQRQRYKDDFNAEYDTYKELHTKVDTITKKFIDLQRLLETTDEGSDNYENIKSQVVEEYEIIKKEHPDFQDEKRHCQRLHAKLARIKKLIMEYDQSQLMDTS